MQADEAIYKAFLNVPDYYAAQRGPCQIYKH